jgi:hypothetical protein
VYEVVIALAVVDGNTEERAGQVIDERAATAAVREITVTETIDQPENEIAGRGDRVGRQGL